MTSSVYAQRLSKLREYMTKAHVDYFLVPAADPHQNEYVPAHWQRRQWLSGFTGSAGDVLVTHNDAILWTDSRYTLQAEQELDASCFTLGKAPANGLSALEQWLIAQPEDFVLAIDPKLMPLAKMQNILRIVEKKNARLYLVMENWIDAIWTDQPPLPSAPIEIFALNFAGVATADKLQRLRECLLQEELQGIFLSNLDAIAWLFNIRGRDIPHNPCVISYALVTHEQAILFVDEQKLTPDVQHYFAEQKIKILPYQAVAEYLHKQRGTLWLDPKQTSVWIEKQLTHADACYLSSPISAFKAVKNKVEQNGMQQAHRCDAIAVIRFLHWLETHWQDGITELSAAEKLDALRKEHPECVDLSFTTISGFGAHGAIVHYSVSEKTSVTIDDSSLYLIDSGGQYRTGTTDVTRTVHLGTPTAKQKHHYTLVLQGHLNLRALVFPQGTCGEHIDAIAHAPLWQEGLDYSHGTGHGVGHFACVHEFPPAISARITHEPLKAGMVVSNEPGLYLTGEYGIRIENLCLVEEVFSKAKSLTGHGPFLGFRDLTLVPYCRALIDVAMLTSAQLKAINDYHQTIFQTLAPHLKDPQVLNWLNENTAPLTHF